MNNLNKITGFFLATLTLIAFVSCNKENHDSVASSTVQTRLIIRPITNQDRVGEEDEEEIIQGQYQDSNGLGIDNAIIELMHNSDTTIVDSDTTDQLGTFEVSATAGTYLFKISKGSSTPIFTNTFQLMQDMQITIQE